MDSGAVLPRMTLSFREVRNHPLESVVVRNFCNFFSKKFFLNLIKCYQNLNNNNNLSWLSCLQNLSMKIAGKVFFTGFVSKLSSIFKIKLKDS